LAKKTFKKKETLPVVESFKKNENIPPKTYEQLLPSLSPVMQKICNSNKEKPNSWFESLQYLQCNIDDLEISNAFLDPGSEINVINNATIEALGWEIDKPSNFNVKGNSKHLTESLGWITNVPVSFKDRLGKSITGIGNFVQLDNGELDPLLCLGMSFIKNIQGVLDPNKNQFHIKIHEKSYTIPTYSKTPKPVESTSCHTTAGNNNIENQNSNNSSKDDCEGTSEELKKNA
jgi:hypothetical protein